MRRLTILGVWAVAAAAALVWAWQTKVGPVVLQVTADHGIHRGDVVGAAIALAWAAVATLALGPERPRR